MESAISKKWRRGRAIGQRYGGMRNVPVYIKLEQREREDRDPELNRIYANVNLLAPLTSPIVPELSRVPEPDKVYARSNLLAPPTSLAAPELNRNLAHVNLLAPPAVPVVPTSTGYSSRFPGSTLKEKRQIRCVESHLRKAGKGLKVLSRSRKSDLAAHIEKEPDLRKAVAQLLTRLICPPTPASSSSPKLAIFRQIVADIGSDKYPVTEESIMDAFEFVKEFNVPMYGDRLKMLVRVPQASSQIIMDKGDGIFGYDEPLQVLAKLAGSSDYGSPTDSSPLHLFREAWDKVSFVKMQIREMDLHDGPELPDIDFEKKWREEAGEELFREAIEWWTTFDKGSTWKDWCDGFHGGHRESRGILLLLMVVLRPGFMLVPGEKLEPRGGDLTESQIEWISVYVKEMPELVRLAEFLSPWAVELYRKGCLGLDDLEVFGSGLDAILEQL